MLSTGLGGGFEAEGVERKGTMKRPLEEGDEKAEAEGICREEGSADVEAFFALLEKIAATEKVLGLRQGTNKTETADKHMKTTETMKTTWRPAFEWQDFCSSANGPRDVAAKAEEESSDSKERISDSNHETARMCIDGEDDNNCNGGGTESLDLNLPSTSPGLQLSL